MSGRPAGVTQHLTSPPGVQDAAPHRPALPHPSHHAKARDSAGGTSHALAVGLSKALPLGENLAQLLLELLVPFGIGQRLN